MTPQELEQQLHYFTGSSAYYPLYPQLKLTDGTKFLCEQAKCFWLMDAVASHLGSYRDEDFVVAKFLRAKASNGWILRLEDGNDEVLADQIIEYSDFPLDEITLYVEFDGTNHVILLPSEH